MPAQSSGTSVTSSHTIESLNSRISTAISEKVSASSALSLHSCCWLSTPYLLFG